MDEILPENLKSLDVVGLSWLTCLCNIVWRSGTVLLDWAKGVVVPLFKKGYRRVCSNYRGITLLSLPRKVYARVLERSIQPVVELLIQEEQCGFRPGPGKLDQLYTLTRVLEDSWEFARPVHMCFMDLEKALDCVGRSGSIGRSIKGCLVSGAGAWIAFPAVSQTCSRCMLDSGRAALCHQFCSLFLWTELLGAARGLVRGPQDFIFAICRWCCLVGFIGPGPSVCTGTVCSRVWRGGDENQYLQVRGHGARPEKGGFPSPGWRRVFAPGGGV